MAAISRRSQTFIAIGDEHSVIAKQMFGGLDREYRSAPTAA